MKTDSNITYRILVEKDSSQVLALIQKDSNLFAKGGLAQLPKNESDYVKWMSQKDECIIGAFQKNTCIGFAGATLMCVGQMKDYGAGLWYGVDINAQGQGVATFATTEALRHFNQKFSNVDTAFIHCQSKNKKSLALAARLGFDKTPEADYRRYQSSRSFTSFEAHSSHIAAVLSKDLSAEFNARQVKKKVDRLIKAQTKTKTPSP